MIRDRVKGLRRVRAGELRPHPRNWRLHPTEQKAALRGVLREIGFADALLARELADGSLELVDGHLRAQVAPEMEVPVLVLDLSDEEAEKLLLLHDPLTVMAETDRGALEELLARVAVDEESLQGVLERMAAEGAQGVEQLAAADEVPVPECYGVMVDCGSEEEQRRVFERLRGEGYRCRVLTL